MLRVAQLVSVYWIHCAHRSLRPALQLLWQFICYIRGWVNTGFVRRRVDGGRRRPGQPHPVGILFGTTMRYLTQVYFVRYHIWPQRTRILITVVSSLWEKEKNMRTWKFVAKESRDCEILLDAVPKIIPHSRTTTHEQRRCDLWI